jgi:nicotinamide riboside kinase
MQRDGPHVRARFHALLTAWLDAHALAHLWVRGDGDARIKGAAAAISAMLAAR